MFASQSFYPYLQHKISMAIDEEVASKMNVKKLMNDEEESVTR